jgi:hypothetical protein
MARTLVDRAAKLEPGSPALKRVLAEFQRTEEYEQIGPIARQIYEAASQDRDRLLAQQTPEDQLLLVSGLANGSYHRDQLADSRRYAERSLQLAEQLPDYSQTARIRYESTMLLGKIAERNKDKAAAVRHLQQASELSAAVTVPIHDSYELHRKLVDWGEREAVARALETKARRHQERQKLLDWAAAIRRGEKPDMIPFK